LRGDARLDGSGLFPAAGGPPAGCVEHRLLVVMQLEMVFGFLTTYPANWLQMGS
jgi:hypothetical protein